jgi:hypothetical protein
MHRKDCLGLLLLIAGCGSLGGPGGGASNLPVSGSGPFSPLDPSDPRWSSLSAPFVLQDGDADLDSPFVLARGDRLSLWATTTRSHVIDIERAEADQLESGFGALQPALVADQPWEEGAVQSPSLIAGNPIVPAARWIMFYNAGGAIGLATSTTGTDWSKHDGPTLIADGAEEGDSLSSPAAVRIGDRVRVYYLASGAVWAAEAEYAEVAAMRSVSWTRLDGDTRSSGRDPIITRPTWARAIVGVTAHVTETPAGRLRHDLYFTAASATYMRLSTTTGCGFASSYTGEDFVIAAAPIVPISQPRRGPAETPYRAGALLLFIEQAGARRSVAAATSP